MKYQSPYLYDFGIAKKYGESHFKVMSFRCLPNLQGKVKKFTEKGEAGNDQKLKDNLARSKARVQELALCNPWTLFVTLTLDPEKRDRQDLSRYIKDFAQFIRDYRKKTECAVRYLLIPEKHKDGSWHMHGFLMGLPISALREFTLQEHLPHKIRDRIKAGKHVYTWMPYQEKFGFADVEIIENSEASARYITKYVTKDALRSVTELNAHIFYASKGLSSAEIIRKEPITREIVSPDYQNEHVAVKWCKNCADALSYFEERSLNDFATACG